MISQHSHNFEQQEAVSCLSLYCNKLELHNNSDNKCKCGTLGDLVPFLTFKKHEKHPTRSITFTKKDTPPWVFFMFLNLYQRCQIVESISIEECTFLSQCSMITIASKVISTNENLSYLIYFPPKLYFFKLPQ